jgi:hypothetical protein
MTHDHLLPPIVGLCPHCGDDTFTVGREVTIWQTLSIRFTTGTDWDHADGHDQLHDTLDCGPFESTMNCDGCGRDVRFPQETPAP